MLVTQTSGNSTSLNGAILAGATTLTVADASNINGNGSTEILIDGEAFNVTAKAGKNLTVTPADLGTTTAAHANNATVTVLKYSANGSGATTTANMLRDVARSNLIVVLQSLMAQFPVSGPLQVANSAVTNGNGLKSTAQNNAAQ